MIALALVLFWVVCGVLSFGVLLAYAQREWPEIAEQEYKRDLVFCSCLSLLGPVALVMGYVLTGFAKHGFMYRNHNKVETEKS